MPSFHISTFLVARNLSQPTGRPLYSYRCTEHEFAELAECLRVTLPEAVRKSRVSPQTAQAFCLWAAEWWRANYGGGPWRWEDLLAAIGVEVLGPSGTMYGQLCQIVMSGLQAWNRPLLRTSQGRLFLITLACEGGLPLQMLKRDQAGLRRYFRAVLEEFRVYGAAGIPEHELAARVSDRLPRSLRQEVVYELSGRLVAQVRELQGEISDWAAPLAELDRERPGWREDLPLRLTDEIAATLLHGLLLDANRIARGGASRFRWTRYLTRRNNEWELSGELRLPTSIGAPELSTLFGTGDQTVPARFELASRADGGDVVVQALGTTRLIGDQSRTVLERFSERRGIFRGEASARGQSLVLRSAGDMLETSNFPGAAPLSELPWVWVAANESAAYELAGQGATGVRGDHALVAVRSGVRLEILGDESGHELLGRVAGVARDVYRIHGSVCFLDDDGLAHTIRTGTSESGNGVEYLLSGRRRDAHRDGTPVFLGPPQVLEWRADGGVRRIPHAQVLWASDAPASQWVQLTPACVGDGRIRYVQDGEVRFAARTKILPSDAQIRFRPGVTAASGVIDFIGVGAAVVRLLAPTGVEWSAEVAGPGLIRFQLTAIGAVPADLVIEMEWAGGGRLRTSLPFPAGGTAYHLPAGDALPHGRAISLGRLSGIRASAVVPVEHARFYVEGTYVGADSHALAGVPRTFRVPMDQLDVGRFGLDLGCVEREAHLRLARCEDPDGAVRLVISTNEVANLARSVIRVKPFDLWFEAEGEPGILYVATDTYPGLPEAEAAALCVEAVPLWDSGREPVLFAYERDRRWRIPVDAMESGLWLISGRQGDLDRVRPMTYCVGLAETPDEAGRFAAVFRGGADQRGTLTDFVHSLAADGGHPDWPIVWNLAQRARTVPAGSFAVLRRIASCPEAAALAVLRAPPEDLRAVWSALDALPFWWRHVSRAAWECAVKALVVQFRRELAALPPGIFENPEEMLRTHVSGAIRRASGELGTIGPVLTLQLCTTLRMPLPPDTSRLYNPAMRGYLLREYRAALAQSPGFAPRSVPVVDGLEGLLTQLSGVPGASELLQANNGNRGNEEYRTLQLAPAITALASLTNHHLSPAQQMQLRAVGDLYPDWFADVHHHASLFLVGASHQLAGHDADGRRSLEVLPLTH